MSKNIVETVIENGSFSTLVSAVQAADLVETLSSKGPFTVFAPTDEAFKKLPAGTVENLLEDKDQLVKVLTYHVVSGKVMSKDVLKLTEAETVQGSKITFDTTNGVKVNSAKVIKADIQTSNGVTHVIDEVLLPH